MYKKVLTYIKENKLINEGDKILVALSGGPDSICLLNILEGLKDELKIELGAAHLNHLLRGDDAYADEKYVIETCKQKNIPCFVKRVDINQYSKEAKLSSELAGRTARYDFFNDIMKEHGYTKVATAHNANDQAETILFRLMRGTGLEGLGGIKVKRDKVIRPILCLTRKEVEKFVADKNIEARIDKTNFEKTYNRNKIRLDILPYMKENFNEDIVETLNRMSVLIQKDNEYLENQANKIYNKSCKEENKYFILEKDLFEQDEAIVTRVIRHAITKFSHSHYDFEMKHIYEVYNLSQNETGKLIDLPNQIYAENIYGDIYIKYKDFKYINDSKSKEVIYSKKDIDKRLVDYSNYQLSFSVTDNTNNINLKLKNDSQIKYFDYDKIQERISIRNRKDGDKIVPIGMTGSKKVKDIFINMKIPKDERDSIPFLCFDNDIAWIVGIRISEKYKITNNTKKILQVTVKRKEL